MNDNLKTRSRVNLCGLLMPAAICLILAGCGTTKVAVVYWNNGKPTIKIGEADNNVTVGPCGFVSGVRKWETAFYFDTFAQTYNVNETKHREVEGYDVVFSGGTLSFSQDTQNLNVKLINRASGNGSAWTKNGIYQVEWFAKKNFHPPFAQATSNAQ
jgi:hypothetical protein